MQTLSPITYYTPAQTAGMIRTALKQTFPTTKFRVTTSKYAGGSTISVRYTAGPSVREVREVAEGFEAKGFDGMIDMSYSVYAWVLNGQVISTCSKGTESSRGSVPSWGLIPPHDDAELVWFGGSSIHVIAETEEFAAGVA